MKPITLKEALLIYVDAVLKNSWAPQLYLKDEVDNYHGVDAIDLARDRLCCDDGYWDYYEYIVEAEGSENHKLFIEEGNNDEKM